MDANHLGDKDRALDNLFRAYVAAGLSNGVLEAINGKIQAAKQN